MPAVDGLPGSQVTEPEPRRVRMLCGRCGKPVFFAAKSHKHYTHLNDRGDCYMRVVPGENESITPEVLEWR